MKGICSVVVILCITVYMVYAEPWTKSVNANLTLTQNAYSNNWVGTEVGAVAWAFNSNSLFEKQISSKINNKNTLTLAFGQTVNQDKDTKKWLSPNKSTDLIDFESLLRFTLGILVDPFVSGRIESQFIDMSDTTKNRFINPVKFTESFGIARTIIKQDKLDWSARIGAGFRQNLNRLVAGGTESTNDGGIEFITDFTTPLAQERITYTSELSLFQALYRSGSPTNDNWKAVDANWENIFTVSITQYLMVNLYAQFLYDKEIDASIRIKEGLSLGVTLKVI
jgi:hypothetical protein